MTAHQTIRPAPIVKRLEVKAPLERTFDTFVNRMGDWWPREHSLAQGKTRTGVVVEPRVGGRWYETMDDGSEIQWGDVRAWDRPSRVLLVWRLTVEFRFDPDFDTEVEVRFTEQGGVTVVEFEHRNLERFGETAVQTAGMMDQGWGQILGEFVKAAEGG